MNIFFRLSAPLFWLLVPSTLLGDNIQTGRDWIEAKSERAVTWLDFGTLHLPSGELFIGDPSWGDDYHMRGARSVPVDQLRVWVHVENPLIPRENQVHAVWLAAADTPPAKIVGKIDFGMDSAYFAFGDVTTGHDLVAIKGMNHPDFYDSFDFFLPHIQQYGFVGQWLNVPQSGRPTFAVDTKRDGGLTAVWTEDSDKAFAGILIDLTGRVSDRLFLDTLIQ